LFYFKVVYVPGSKNMLAVILSRIYSSNLPGTVRAHSKYAYVDVVDDDMTKLSALSQGLLIPMLAEIEAQVMTLHHLPRPELSREIAK
jgi:hypothetical protein